MYFLDTFGAFISESHDDDQGVIRVLISNKIILVH